MRTVIFAVLFFVLLLIFVPLIIGSFKTPLPNNLDVDIMVKVWLEAESRAVNMRLGDYLVGVVAAEMPASFNHEALRAQAVAARTYAYRRLKLYGGSGCQKNNADVCSSFRCCQAFYTKEELKKRWGSKYNEYYYKIAKAVSSTAGWIIVHNNLPIDPLFHSTCGGHTENSGEVWQKDLPYLQGVECEYCQNSPKYYQTKQFTVSQAAALVAADQSMVLPVANLKATLPRMSVNKRTATNRVAELKIGSIVYKGVNLRSVLGLNSTWFTWKLDGDKIIFTTRGYGHGVGMCQYGANGLAQNGYKCQDILKYYYQGVEIKKISAPK